ncbi:twin-arginine translocase TatA/TatE family subunit [Parvibaculum sp.]|jgi:sec-independent protein translocase protein TatA|uniref:twin-arginine translocase TatA/TatE family subunit n=1 Tax=Parvibaculum sp. TaxID=2024848 RepID=UPI000C4C5CF1|nr:twin-arginine translocase TatA/TatE family subunit [Parvibaculum sp.]MAM93672.1 twin-arginine translocase TatA/TatE family subunit [Parvibaculum sp.]HCX67613.1 twin-arginine translocase TatA/TatE family subunit [Rhodobiaceae bacterium]|tara:strand:+ start:18181 stop:18408 length:228 start_codon:yes stop_codon:yes gene_type:complete
MPGWTQILIVLVLIVLLFGRGKISDMMGDVAKGIRSFKKGLADEDEVQSAQPEPKTIDATASHEENAEKNKASHG